MVPLYLRYASSKKEMRAMAMRLGLQQWPDDSTPRDLALDTTAFKHWSKLFNVYEGILNGHQVAVFDLRKKAGKSSYSRTILAVRSNENLLNGTAFELEKTQVDKWQLAYLPTGFLIRSQLMEVADIEESLKFIECI
jgi:hypothetical protein